MFAYWLTLVAIADDKPIIKTHYIEVLPSQLFRNYRAELLTSNCYVCMMTHVLVETIPSRPPAKPPRFRSSQSLVASNRTSNLNSCTSDRQASDIGRHKESFIKFGYQSGQNGQAQGRRTPPRENQRNKDEVGNILQNWTFYDTLRSNFISRDPLAYKHIVFLFFV